MKTQFDQWAAKVEDSDNFRTLGLRAFYLKHFTRAAENFTKAALQGEQRRKALKERLLQEDLATFENWKDAGNSYYADYKFREALEMNIFLVKQSDSYGMQALFRLVENFFTTGLYNEGNHFIQKLRADLKDPSYSKFPIISKIFEIANYLGLNDTSKAAELLENLIKQVEKQPTDFKLVWNFTGTKYFIRTHKTLEPQREWLL